MLGTGNDKKFQVSIGYRESYATKLYNRSREDKSLTRALRPREWLDSIDLSATYNATPRFSISGSLPIIINRISFLIPPGSGGRYGLPGAGIGDLSFLARTLVLDPRKHPTANIGLGAGIKIPTGDFGPKETYPNVQGVFARKPVTPNSIPPGDGGTGAIFEAIAFKTFTKKGMFKGSNILVSGNYLVNPRNQNGVASAIAVLGLAGPGEINALTNSVADSYSVRSIFTMPIPGVSKQSLLNRVKLQASYRWEGITSRDLLGGNKGFRQPGYVMAVGPGVSVRLFQQTRLVVEVPITINGRINANPNIPVGGPLRWFGFIAPVTVLARVTSSF